MKKFLALLLLLPAVLCGQTTAIYKFTDAARLNDVTGNVNFPASTTLTMKAASTLAINGILNSSPTSGTVNYTNVTLTIGSATATAFTGPATTNLTLTGGSAGASLVLGQGVNGLFTLKSVGTGRGVISGSLGASSPTVAVYNDTSNTRTTFGVIGNGSSSQTVLQFGYGSPSTFTNTGNVFVSATDFQINTSGFISFGIAAGAEWARFSTTNGNLLLGGTVDISGTGGLKLFGTTDATAANTGSLQNLGGFYNAKQSWFGDNLTASVTHAISQDRFLQFQSNSSGTLYGATFGYALDSGGNPYGRIRRLHANVYSDVITFLTASGDVKILTTTEATVGGAGSVVASGGIYATKKIVTQGGFIVGAIGGSVPAWGATGPQIHVNGAVFTDTTSAGVVSLAAMNTFASSALAASAVTTYTSAATLYIAGPPSANTNVTITNAYSLFIGSGNSFFNGSINTFSSGDSSFANGYVGRFAGDTSYARFGHTGASGNNVYALVQNAAGATQLNGSTLGLFLNNSNIANVLSTGFAVVPTTEATTGGAGSITTAGGVYASKKIVTNTDMIVGATLTVNGTGTHTFFGSLRSIGGSGVGMFEFLADGSGSGYGSRLVNNFNGGSAYDLLFQSRTNSASWTTDLTLAASGGHATIRGNLNVNGTGSTVIAGTLFVSTGLSLTAASAGFELGGSGSVGTPFIDFHSSSTAQDYDARLIASGGGVGVGLGTLSVTAASFVTSGAATVNGNLTVGGGSILGPGASALSIVAGSAQSVLIKTNGGTTAATFDSAQGMTLVGVLAVSGTGLSTIAGRLDVAPTVAAGQYTLQALGANGAARDVFLAGVTGVSNGFNVQYDGTKMVYTFSGSTSTTALNGLVGVGGAATTTSALIIRNQSTTAGTTQIGIDEQALFSSTATTAGRGVSAVVQTSAAAFTMTNAYAFYAQGPVVGAGSAITTSTGLIVNNMGAAGVTNAYGIDITAQSGAATLNVGLRNAASSLLDGEVTIRSTTATPAGGSTTARLLFGTTAAFGVYYGSGAPTVSAAQGSIYLRSDGSSTTTRAYINTNGSTTWTAITTSS